MKKFENVKNIKIDVEFEGNGCVNFDAADNQKFMMCKVCHVPSSDGQISDNTLFAKKNFYINEDGKYTFKYKVSSECLRHEIMGVPFDNPGIVQLEHVLLNTLATPEFITRGYMYAQGENKPCYKKKSPFAISDAEEVGQARSAASFEIGTLTTSREHESGAATSLYNVENVGRNTYKATGFIDLTELQFIPDSTLYDRTALANKSLNKRETKIYLDALSRNMINMSEPKFDYYYSKSCYGADELGENGVLLNKESVDMLVKHILTNILNFHVARAKAFLNFKKLTLTVQNSSGMPETIEITSVEDLKDLFFDYAETYVLGSEEQIKENLKKLAEYSAKQKESKGSKKGSKKGKEEETDESIL